MDGLHLGERPGVLGEAGVHIGSVVQDGYGLVGLHGPSCVDDIGGIHRTCRVNNVRNMDFGELAWGVESTGVLEDALRVRAASGCRICA